jgi:hypothetical protein
MAHNPLTKNEISTFDATFDACYENAAISCRGEFLRKFPLKILRNIAIDDYVIGRKTPTFCAYVEAKTRSWASINGVTSKKFGIYYGREKSDPDERYRFGSRWGDTPEQAFDSVRSALLDLLRDGKEMKFQAVDENPLSQMFKAKILSLYFPDLYLNVCSSEHLVAIAKGLAMPNGLYASEYQHRLIQQKQSIRATSGWTNPKYMSLLYAKYINRNLGKNTLAKIQKPKVKNHRTVNFEDILEARRKKGIMSEEFAHQWEINRLIGLGYDGLANRIDDRRARPGYGYDYLSYSGPNKERFIEVKSALVDKAGNYQFYLSENEYWVSKQPANHDLYYFYLVIYNKMTPVQVIAVLAKDLYQSSTLKASSHLVSFSLVE